MIKINSIGNVFKQNVESNAKKILAIIGDILLTIFTVILIAVKAEMDIVTTVVLLAISVRPFITSSINIIFKGESDAILQQNKMLTKQLETQQEVHEYRCRLAASLGETPAAINSTAEWLKLNDQLNQVKKAAQKPKPVPVKPVPVKPAPVKK